MTVERPRFWSSDRRARYLAETAGKTESARRVRDGEDTAAGLDDIWPDLTEQEREFLRALVVVDRQSFIARHGARPLRGLVAKGLLLYPQGQGGNWMRESRTSYTVAPAVWRKLQSRSRETLLDRATASFRTPSEAESILADIIASSQ